MSLDSDALLLDQEGFDSNQASTLLLGGDTHDKSLEYCRHQPLAKPALLPINVALKLLIAISLLTVACIVGFAALLDYHIRVYSQESQPCRHDAAKESLAYFSDVGWRTVTTQPDFGFQHTDPGHGQNGSEIWHKMRPTTMVAVPNAARYGLSGGGKTWANPDDFDDTTEAFLPVVMHDMHCVIYLKSSLHALRRGEAPREDRWEHLFHCTERLRQAVLCHGDLSLERPRNTSVWPQKVDGWGEQRECRDEDAMFAAMKRSALTVTPNGWRRAVEEDFLGPLKHV